MLISSAFINVFLSVQLSFPSDSPTGAESKSEKAESLEKAESVPVCFHHTIYKEMPI